MSVECSAHHVQAGDAGGEGAAGTGQQLGGRPFLDHVSVLHHQDAVGEQECVEYVVGDDHRGAVIQHPAQHLADCGSHCDVEGGHRLIQEQEPWVRCKCSGNRDPLGLPAGELCRFAVGVLRGIDLAQPALGERA